MCGIFFAVSVRAPRWPTPEHEALLRCRGPDSCHRAEAGINEFNQSERSAPMRGVHITFLSTVLSLRGEITVEQPYKRDEEASRLCWNGEAWTIDGLSTDGNDTQAVYDELLQVTQAKGDDTVRRADKIARALSQIAGPYAFVFHDALHDVVYFGRDFLGRRSLLTCVTEGGDLLISSVTDNASGAGWAEVEADGVYCINLKQPADQLDPAQPWTRYGDFGVMRVPYHLLGDQACGDVKPVGRDGSSMSAFAHG